MHLLIKSEFFIFRLSGYKILLPRKNVQRMGTHQGNGNNPHLQGYIGKQAQDSSPFGMIQSFILAPAFAELSVCIFSTPGMCLNEAFWQWIML